MGSGGSLPHSQEPATCPYPEPAQSSPCPLTHFLQTHFNIILPSTPGSPKWCLPSGLPIKILYGLLLPPCVLHAPPISFLLLWTTRSKYEACTHKQCLCFFKQLPSKWWFFKTRSDTTSAVITARVSLQGSKQFRCWQPAAQCALCYRGLARQESLISLSANMKSVTHLRCSGVLRSVGWQLFHRRFGTTSRSHPRAYSLKSCINPSYY
jgi:hypothetical protein